MLISILAILVGTAWADSSKLTIQSGTQTKIYKLGELLKRKDLQSITVPADPAYNNKEKTYRAIPIAELFKDIAVPEDGTVVFKCLDGFSGPLNRADLLNVDPNKAMAFLALEDPKKKWNKLKSGNTPGPFYLIWQYPEKSNIGREQWPFQLAGLDVKPSVASQYPLIVPKTKDKIALAGFDVFVKNCFACHTMNGQGTSQVGPDLNIPFNVMEYLSIPHFQRLVRDPQALRRWPQAKMKGFPVSEIPDLELEQLTGYLIFMQGQKALVQ